MAYYIAEGTGPKIYFNHGCFSGPFLSKSRILDLPESLNISHVRVMVKEMLNFIISVGYKSSYILKLLQRTDTSNPQLQRQIIKTKYDDINYPWGSCSSLHLYEKSRFCLNLCCHRKRSQMKFWIILLESDGLQLDAKYLADKCLHWQCNGVHYPSIWYFNKDKSYKHFFHEFCQNFVKLFLM